MRLPVCLLAMLVVGCGQTRGVEHGADASAPVATRAEPSAIRVLRSHASLVDRAGVGGSLATRANGVSLATTSGFRTGAIDAVLPAHLDRPMRVAVPGRPDAWLEIVAEGARSVEPRTADRALVHEDAFAATDVVHVVDASRAEELRVLRGEAAPKSARWTIARGPEITALRITGDRVEALDGKGHVAMSTEPIVAIDANDVRRTPKIRLEGNELVVELDTEGLAYPIVLDPSWVTASTSTNHVSQFSPYPVKLADGRILLLGQGPNINVYDPVTDTWQADVPAQHALYGRATGASHTMLPTGKVLISGASSSSAELYDPALLKSTATGMPVVPTRAHHTATLLASTNRVVMVGGDSQSTVEVYDIATGTYSSVSPLPAGRGAHVAALLTTGPNAGKILLAGGNNSVGYLSTAELLDPATWTSTPITPALSGIRKDATITLITKGALSGKYLIVGGGSNTVGSGLSTTDIYDPLTNTFSAGPPMTAKRANHAAITLSDGRLLVACGDSQYGAGYSGAEVYDPTSATLAAPGAFVALANPNTGLNYPSLAELSGGRILLAGEYAYSQVYWPDGVTCTTAASCPSGNCVDGYCCDTPCTGQCMACDVAARQGVCSPVSGGPPHGTRTACTPYSYCTNGACATTCASDAVCASGSYCDFGTTTCVTKKPNGSGCAAANECTSGNCVDGYCCNSSCAGTCSACDVAGSAGTCTSVVGTPHGSRSCPSPYACASTGSCASGSCTVDTDCATGRYCDSTGACSPKLSNGVACTADSNCASSHCVDGYCCNTTCTGNCQACNVAGLLGTCSNVASGPPHGTRSCAPYATCNAGACSSTCAAPTDCTTGSYCSASKCVGGKALGQPCGAGGECASGFCADGVCCSTSCTADCGSCALPGTEGTCSPRPSTATCGIAGCSGSKMVAIGHCSGTSTACVGGAATPCPGSLVCADATSCKTSCATDVDCTTGACDTASGKCTSPDGGVADTGVTTDSSTSDSGPDAIAMEPAPKLGDHPTVDGFTRCTKASECSTGFCVDGVCCDSACKDACHSCALLSSPGKCTLEPVGVDLRENCGPANTCLGTCDGKGQCIGAGAGTMCGRNRCTEPSKGVGPAYCAGPGADCPTDDAVPFDCAPYICEPAFGACRTECTTSADCANGFVCDVGSKTCVAPPDPAQDDGGCGFGGPSKHHGAALLAMLLIASRFGRRAR